MNKIINLNINQRLIASLFYLIIFLGICSFFNNGWSFLSDSNSNYNLLFVSGALLLIFGTYIAEPYFTKPIDVLTNSIAVILALLTIEDRSAFWGYWEIIYTSLALMSLSIVNIFFSQTKFFPKTQKVFFEIITKFGQSKILFSVIYIATLFSFFSDRPLEFSIFFSFWIIFTSQYLVENIILWISKILRFIFKNEGNHEILGIAIGCENPFLYKIEVDYFKHKNSETKKGQLVYLSLEKNVGAVGIIINEKYLLNKKWITIYLLEEENAPLKIDLKKQGFITSSKTIFSKDSAVYNLNLEDINDPSSKSIIQYNYLFKNKENFIGYVDKGSDINKIMFHSLIDSENDRFKDIKEGVVIKTKIHNRGVLYQIIDGVTKEEELEKHSTYGYLSGIAKKLGRYNTSNGDLNIVKWVPNIYAPVFLNELQTSFNSPLSIGVLPETSMQIAIKDIDSLVTHNTAILGILGSGKSCLTFELLKKLIENSETNIVCIDITNEYIRELVDYISPELIQSDLSIEDRDELKTKNTNGNPDQPATWGNEADYKTLLDTRIKEFNENSKRLLILNPDLHSVSKAASQFRISDKVDLSVAEKTRIISERLFIYAKNNWNEGEVCSAKHLLVFEEAHSLIPEWNSVANAGDQNASNGTAKVVLQGRKYGLGSFVVTQRTANISKSILNQCNTIFALRVFDDTGKQFLENYIGSDYANTLPTLEDRHAIAVGKALKLSQPLIIQLNNKEDVL